MIGKAVHGLGEDPRTRWSLVHAKALVIAVTITAALALPASASADLVVSQTAFPKPVKKGELVTITVNVTNTGPYVDQSNPNQVELFSLRGGTEGSAVNDPYQSATPSQGTCTINPTGKYQVADCDLGDLAPGASARIVAVVRVNQSMNHRATPRYGAPSELNVAASAPPTVTGAKQIKLKGLPTGCVPGNFTLTIATSAPRVKRVVAAMDLGFDREGFGVVWQRSANGNRLKVKVPVSSIFDARIGKTYKLTLVAQRKRAGSLRRTVMFELCGASAAAKRKPKPPWAGKTYSGRGTLRTGQAIGVVSLRVASDGKSLTYKAPWKCGTYPVQTSTHKIAVKSNGSFRGGVTVNTGNPGISFFLAGRFSQGGRVHGKFKPAAAYASGTMNGSIYMFVAPGQYEDGCETGNVAYPETAWTVSRK